MGAVEIVGVIAAALSILTLAARLVVRLYRLMRMLEEAVPTLFHIVEQFPNDVLARRLLDIETTLDRQAQVLSSSVIDIARNSVRVERLINELHNELKNGATLTTPEKGCEE